MMSIPALVEAFNQIIGWPYRLGGTTENGIDCSGAFVRAYELQGQKIYHGSNRIIREYCNGAFPIERESQLKVGMAVFKQRSDLSRMKAEYKPGGRYYDPALPNDYYHIGLVTGVSPLKIVSATTPVARQDTRLGNWTVAAYLNNVDYDGQSQDPREATVTANQGSTVNLRKAPSLSATILARVPLRQTVLVSGEQDEWSQVSYQGKSGYMMTEFLDFTAKTPDCDGEEISELRRRISELEALLADEQG